MIQLRSNGALRRMPRCGAHGSSTSAVSVASYEGVRLPKNCLWVPGEGWVRWCDLMKQVEKKFHAWRVKKSLQGVQISDGWALREADMAEALAKKGKIKA